MSSLPISLADVETAAKRLAGVAHRTPVVTSRTLDDLVGARLALKAENFQRGGAFKFRGAFNKLASLPADERDRGVVAFSSGNHAQAVALAARLLGTTATILMPLDTPTSKLVATRGYGAEVVTYDRYTGDREALGAELARERGLALVPPYDDPMIMAGQGTTALELLSDAGELDVLLVPVGGGGLISGCATAAKALAPGIEVIGVEPATGDDTLRSLRAGERVGSEVPKTIADGLQSASPGVLTFEVVKALVDDIVLVDDDQIVSAMVVLFERLKLVVEPSGATAVAAALVHAERFAGKRVGVVISGGNIGADRFADLVGPA